MSAYGDFISLSDVCDKESAALISREVSDGIIAPGYDSAALDILRKKRKGSYTILEVDPAYIPAERESKTVFGLVFEQGRNNIRINDETLSDVVTIKKDIPRDNARDLIISLITLKYTQSNSVCYVKNGQAIGIGAGQQSRIHCSRLAGDKADNWYLRQHPMTLGLPFLSGVGRPERDNIIDSYVSGEGWEVFGEDMWDRYFSVKPEGLTGDIRRDWLTGLTNVALGSDGFFPFEDNIQRAHRSGVGFIAQPGGSIRDKQVIDCCDSFGIAMAFTGVRLFHH
jgi:AICAR transformylase/IMP cyclohydrolase PurH